MAYPFEGGRHCQNLKDIAYLHFKEVFTRWDSAFAKNGWLSVFLANHDQARMVSRFGNDSPEFRECRLKCFLPLSSPCVELPIITTG